MVGKTVSHYRILEKIGEGGMGEVYLAEDEKLRRKVALKFLNAELTRDETRRKRFIQEARAAAAIEHPHIAAIHDIDEAEGRTFIAMEHIEGQSLREAIQGGKLGLRKSLELAVQVAEGLAKAHERGVVHRDIKPENVLVSIEGYAKIIDFGLAKLLEPLTRKGLESSQVKTETKLETRDGLVLGTVAYMSPEQARGEAVDGRSDIFSFGLLLYEMLSGRAPFRRSSVVESLNAVLKDDVPPVSREAPGVPAELERILRRALAKDRAERYQSIRDLAIDLRQARDEMGSAEHPLAMARPWAKRSRWLLGTAAGLSAAVAVALVVLLLSGDRKPRPAVGASGRPAIAVMYFENNSGDEQIRWLSKGLPSMLLTDLAQTPGLDVVSSQRIHEILKDIGQGNVEAIDKSLVPEIARRSGAGAVVVGSIFKSGAEIRIDVQVEDVSSGHVLAAQSVRGTDVFPLVDELTGRIRASLQMTDAARARPIAEVTTPSLEAYRLYSEGMEAWRNLRWVDARQLFEEAVGIDPSFAMAYFRLSAIAESGGKRDESEAYRKKVLENLDRMPERQRLLVSARYARQREGDPDKAARLLETLLSRYPDEEDAYILLSNVYWDLDRPEAVRKALEDGVKALPGSGPLHNQYGYALLRGGRYREALGEFEEYARIKPHEPNPYDSQGETYLIMGRPEKALERYARALEVDPSFIASHGGGAWAYGILGRYEDALREGSAIADHLSRGEVPLTTAHFMRAFVLSRLGRYGEAQEHLRQGVELAETLRDAGRQVALHHMSALLAMEQGDFPRVLKSVARAREILPQVSRQVQKKGQTVMADLLAGIAEARSGNLEAARARLSHQREYYDRGRLFEKWWHQALAGEIALAAGDLPAAEKAFSSGEPDGKMWFNQGTPMPSVFANCLPFRDGLARVKKTRGDLEGAVQAYRELNTPGPDNPWTALFEPRFVLETARLLRKMGDESAARAEYRRFLQWWKDADAGLPELVEARSYLSQ